MLPAAFCDEATIEVCGGRGGRGKVSFLRQRARPLGGPDGGGGGDGGNVVARVKANLATLAEYVHRPRWHAADGEGGGVGNSRGASGGELAIAVPPGTDIYDCATGELHATLLDAGAQTVLAHGGRGGRGNASFRSSTNRAPRESEPGEPGERRSMRLELRLVADIALVGLPNAGKSSLLAALTAARPVIADYPYTTQRPQLGAVPCGELDLERMIMADLPGIAAGSADGAGLGLDFARHAARTQVLLHAADASDGQLSSIAEAVQTVERELAAAGGHAGRMRMLTLCKCDLLDEQDAQQLAAQASEAAGMPAVAVSASTGAGLSRLAAELYALLRSEELTQA